MEKENIKTAIEAMRSARDECETVAVYLERISEAADEGAAGQYREIISDELNHALRFIFNIAVALTGITPGTDGLEGVIE